MFLFLEKRSPQNWSLVFIFIAHMPFPSWSHPGPAPRAADPAGHHVSCLSFPWQVRTAPLGLPFPSLSPAPLPFPMACPGISPAASKHVLSSVHQLFTPQHPCCPPQLCCHLPLCAGHRAVTETGEGRKGPIRTLDAAGEQMVSAFHRVGASSQNPPTGTVPCPAWCPRAHGRSLGEHPRG